MFELIGTIFCSSILFFIFRLFPKFEIDTAQAIVFNYFTAFICGSFVNGQLPTVQGLIDAGLLGWIIICGFLFISIFIAMGVSSQKNGMGITSVAVKMSLAISAIAFIFIHNESITWLKILGFILAIAGVLLITLEKSTTNQKGPNLLLLLFIFIGSAGLDVTLNVIKQNFAHDYPDSLFTAFGFLAAGTIGLIWLSVAFLMNKRKFAFKNIIAGIILGVPNYFSIFFLVRAYETTHWSNATVLAVMNISIVALAAIFGMVLFKESARVQKLIGLLAATIAIICLTIN
jgi:drug/metabolite transporter (DMT)-like permease